MADLQGTLCVPAHYSHRDLPWVRPIVCICSIEQQRSDSIARPSVRWNMRLVVKQTSRCMVSGFSVNTSLEAGGLGIV